MQPAEPSSAGYKGPSNAKPMGPPAVNPVAKPVDHAKEEEHDKPSNAAGDHHIDGIKQL